ncbi:MAG: hypothetical protein HKP41_21555, partial [Desulfobacterales bacterium]|nr:hypothetical protein [Desulfobacterales bacterium]
KADIHGVMDRLEDQDLLLRQYLREMENTLQQKEARIQQLLENKHHIQVDLTARTQEIGKLENDLSLALRKENDTIAKLLIRKQLIEQKHCQHLQRQYESVGDEQKQLGELLAEQHERYEILKVKATNYYARNKQSTASEANGLCNATARFSTINEDEIEIELIRRKEQLAHNGGAA